MANIHGIEVSGENYDLEDSNARQDIQTNSQDIDGIEGKIPDSASTSNKLVTEDDLPEISTSVTENDTNPVSGAAVFNAISVKKVAQTDIVQSSMSFDISALPSGVYAIVAGNCYYQACSASYVYLFGLDRGNNVTFTPCKIVNSFDGVSDPTVTSNSVTIPQLGVFSRAYLLKIA